MRRFILAAITLATFSTAQAVKWEYGKLWQVYEVGPEGQDLVAYWQEGNSSVESGVNFPELYSWLNKRWEQGLQPTGEEDEMDLLTLLGSQGWELAAFNKYENTDEPHTVMEVWYFKRPLPEQGRQ